MGDTLALQPDHTCLFAIASEQHGFFTARQARSCGFNSALLSYHAGTGRYISIRRGLYRLRDYPTSPVDDVMAAWLSLGKELAVVSHESALELHDLGDIIPDAIHLTVPRSRRNLPTLPGVTIHTTTRLIRPDEIAIREGIRVTAPTRSILDAAEGGAAPEQIEVAIAQAIRRGLTTPDRITREASQRNGRVQQRVLLTLQEIR